MAKLDKYEKELFKIIRSNAKHHVKKMEQLLRIKDPKKMAFRAEDFMTELRCEAWEIIDRLKELDVAVNIRNTIKTNGDK